MSGLSNRRIGEYEWVATYSKHSAIHTFSNMKIWVNTQEPYLSAAELQHF
jgi:hypothetical protein